MKNQTIEQAVEEFKAKQTLVEPDGFLADVGEDYEAVDFNMEVMEVWLREALQAQRDAGAREERERIEAQFPDYAHTRYLGSFRDGDKWYYGYDTEVVYLLADFLALTPPIK